MALLFALFSLPLMKRISTRIKKEEKKMLRYVGLVIFCLIFHRAFILPLRERISELEAFEKLQEGV